MRHFINILDYSRAELGELFAVAERLKDRYRQGIRDLPFAGKLLGMYFEKPSLRTRVSLETAAVSLGGSAICLETGGEMAAREHLKDQAQVMSRFVHAVSIRTFGHEIVQTFAAHSSVPVINALSDYSHPTQALADLLTLREHLGELAGKTLVFVGDGNNVARSLAALCARLDMRFVLACPDGYRLDQPFLKGLKAAEPAAQVVETPDVAAAVREAAVVYTDVWASMGQEGEAAARAEIFAPFQVNAALMAKAPKGALVMHCLPAHRGAEITDEVIDSGVSIVYDQAENRMHINRALLAALAGDGQWGEWR